MVDLADDVLIAFASPNGKLHKLISKIETNKKTFSMFNIKEN
jgi:hypothetical protein